MSSEESEEFKTFKINVNRSGAVTLLEPNPFSKLLDVFPKARSVSEWRKTHPQIFARARYNAGFLSAPTEALRIDDGKITALLYENGSTLVGGPTPVLNILNAIGEYAKKLQACELYSKELFASKFVQTARMWLDADQKIRDWIKNHPKEKILDRIPIVFTEKYG